MDSDDLFFCVFLFIILFFLIILVAVGLEEEKVIQDIKPVENGYYITIDNSIYYKEVTGKPLLYEGE